jgi:hypothetical protein
MHVHVSPVEFLSVAAYMVIFGFAWRTIAAKNADTAVGKAMAYIY